jgi:cytochrome c-type biogenesis protein CcmH
MLSFVLLAAVLTVAVVAVIAVPLLRRGPAQAGEPATWSALAAAGVLVVGSAVLYVCWSNWLWHAPPAADSPQGMVAHLARRLEQDPQNRDGWLMLGRSYIVLQEYPLALRAFERADRLSGGRDAEALTGEAEALAMSDPTELDGRAGRLIEQALALDPQSGKALLFGAATAARRGDLPLARQRFAKLLTENPPANVRPFIEQQIVLLDQELARRAGAASAAGTAPAAGGTSSGAGAGASVRVRITLAPSMAATYGSAPLFVFVRDPSRPGPPLAVKRLASEFPQTVELTAGDSMMPGREFAAGESVQVVARIARSGNPVGASGDPFGEAAYRVGKDQLVGVVIDHVVP